MTRQHSTPPGDPAGEGKYARVERERRFLLESPPVLAGAASRRITDRYLPGTRLRLRRVKHLDSGVCELKFTQKVPAGEVGEGLLAELDRSGNVSVARAPEAGQRDGAGPRPARQAGALAMPEAARRQSAYVIVPDDPLAGVAAAWRAMWDVASGPSGAAAFEEQAAQALAAWRDKRFELPDYYLVVAAAQAEGMGQDLYLGPLRAGRPRRVVVAAAGDSPGQAGRVLDALRNLEHGPWWPPLGDLIDGARRFYAGGFAETQAAAG